MDDCVVISNYSRFIICNVGLLLILNQEAEAGETASSGEHLPGNRFTGAGARETGRKTQTDTHRQAIVLIHTHTGRL